MAEAVRAGRAVALLLARGAGPAGAIAGLRRAAADAAVPVRTVERASLDALGLGEHQGVGASVRLPREIGERELVRERLAGDGLVVVLDGITDPRNLGAAARAAEAAGAAVLLTRARRAAPTTPAAVKASAGALLHLPVARVTNLARTLEALKAGGFTVIGLDEEGEHTIHDAPPPRPVALVVGGEGAGLSRLVRERCDLLVRIPTSGLTGSLNAASALAVGLFAYATRPVAG